MRPALIALAALAVFVVAAGCVGTTSSGGPATAPSAGQLSVEADAPRVASPLDVTTYLTQPCAALSPRLRQSLKVAGEGEPNTSGAIGSRAPSCRWSNLATVANGESVGVAFLKANKGGLADLYRGNASRPEAYWQETTVEGYPGVFHDGVDSRKAGQCGLAVGLSDVLAMSVHESGELGAGSCERAKAVAAAVIQTLTGRG